MDIRTFFKKPAGGATTAPKEPTSAPSAPHVEVVSDDDVIIIDAPPAPKAAAVRDSPAAARPASASKRPREETPLPAKKAPKTSKSATPAKPTYPRPPLRPESELDFSVLDQGTGWQPGGAAHGQAVHASGAAVAPRGADDCLMGETFVFTGNLAELSREDADALVKRHGGRVTSAVSSKTSFLVVGHDSGNSKLNKAREHKTPLLDQAGLFALIAASMPQDGPPVSAAVAQPMPRLAEPPSRTAAPRDAVPRHTDAAGPSAPRSVGAGAQSQLWVEKHRPETLSQLVGNGKLISDLRGWLSSWQRTHLAPTGQKGKDAPKKAVLISGPPGIGKTSAARIVCSALGFDVMEVNASDARGKAESDVKAGLNGKCANMVKEMVTNTVVSFGGAAKKTALIMDEVDGMSGGDRGGVADLINSIKASKVPIICICNDRYSQKIKSLKNYCLELDFHRPTKQQIRSRLLTIAAQEGIRTNDIAMEALIESCKSDIRLVLNTLQMRRMNSDTLLFDDVKATSTKDQELGLFNAVDQLFQADQRMSLNARMNVVFTDADIIPLFVQENYVNMRPNAAANDDLRRMELVANSSMSIADGDVLMSAVRRHQRWTLMPYALLCGCLTPTALMRGRREVFGSYPGEKNMSRFPAWLGKNSSQGKQRRLLTELQSHTLLSGNCFANRSSIREEYMPTLRFALTAPMWAVSSGGLEKDGIPTVMQLMESYSLTREDFDTVMSLTQIKADGVNAALRDPASLIPTAVKSAFTRACNDKTRTVRSGILLPDAKKKRKGGAAKEAPDGDEDEEDEEDNEAEEVEEEIAHDPKKLAAMQKRGLELSLKEGVGVAKAKPRAAPSKAKGASAKAPAKPRAKAATAGKGKK